MTKCWPEMAKNTKLLIIFEYRFLDKSRIIFNQCGQNYDTSWSQGKIKRVLPVLNKIM